MSEDAPVQGSKNQNDFKALGFFPQVYQDEDPHGLPQPLFPALRAHPNQHKGFSSLLDCLVRKEAKFTEYYIEIDREYEEEENTSGETKSQTVPDAYAKRKHKTRTRNRQRQHSELPATTLRIIKLLVRFHVHAAPERNLN